MLVVAVLLVIHSYLVVHREVAQFRSDMDLHAYLLGTVLASSIADVWTSVGPERAMSIVADANRSEGLVRVRLVRLDQSAPGADAPIVSSDRLSALLQGEEVLLRDHTASGVRYHIAYFPLSVDVAPLRALELSQPLAPMQNYTRTTILQKIGLFLAFLVVGSLLVWWLGIRLVGRPVRALVHQALGVGQGKLYSVNDLERSNDEIGLLAKGLNRMVKDLRTARSRLEQETAERLAVVEQLNHAERLSTVGKLASGLAHELGTPLNVVTGRAKLIANGGMSEGDAAASAGVIKQQAERMTELIRKLLDFARRSPAAKGAESLAHLVEQVAHLLSPLASGRGCAIVVPEAEDSTKVEVDAAQVQQVLSNLVVNAVHAMPDGGTVTLSYGTRQGNAPADHAGPTGDYAFIDVSDDGVGIPEENLGRIFTPFFTTKQVGEGTGLGLSIAHGIIKEHGGWIEVASKIGEGSTFSIYLPRAEVE